MTQASDQAWQEYRTALEEAVWKRKQDLDYILDSYQLKLRGAAEYIAENSTRVWLEFHEAVDGKWQAYLALVTGDPVESGQDESTDPEVIRTEGTDSVNSSESVASGNATASDPDQERIRSGGGFDAPS